MTFIPVSTASSWALGMSQYLVAWRLHTRLCGLRFQAGGRTQPTFMPVVERSSYVVVA
jgi:hypothetical protein